MRERLQKVLASAGVASRREAEELIKSGKVKVNGRTVTEMGSLADITQDVIYVRGERLQPPQKPLTIMLYKPHGVITTMDDPEGRRSVADLVQDEAVRLFPVGRLDRQSEGLLLMTNDGDLANLLTHPRYGVSKIYHVELSRELDLRDQQKLEKGVELEDGPTLPIVCEQLPQKMGFWYKVVISEGRNRQVRRMFEKLGYFVARLRRVQVGNLRLGDLRPGEKRALTNFELERLRSAAQSAVKGTEAKIRKGQANDEKNRSDRRRAGGPARRVERSSKRGEGYSLRTKRPDR